MPGETIRFALDVAGTVCAVEAPEPAASHLRWLLADLLAPPGTPVDGPTFRSAPAWGSWSLQRDRGEPTYARDLRYLGRHLVDALNRVAAEPARPALHAAAVGVDGRAVALLAASFGGKSTLAAALTLAGCAYLSDEIASVLPHTHRIIPFPKPLGLRSPLPGTVLGQLHDERAQVERNWLVPGRQLGAVGGDHVLAAIVALRRAEVQGAELAPLRVAEVLVELGGGSVSLQRRKSVEFAELVALARAVPGYRLTYGDLGHGVDAVTGLLARS